MRYLKNKDGKEEENGKLLQVSLAWVAGSALPPGGGDVAAVAAADIDDHVAVFQVFHKFIAVPVWAVAEAGAFHFVVFDDIDFDGKLAAVDSERFGIVKTVVDAVEEQVFEGGARACLFHKVFQAFRHIPQRVSLVHRHEGVAHRFFRRVERHGEVEAYALIRQAANAGGDACRGESDAVGGHRQPVLGGDAFDGGEDIVIVEERFAHAHEHDVRQGHPLPFRFSTRFRHLLEYLSAGQVTPESQRARRTELAA